MGTITSANAVLLLGVVGLYDTPQLMQGWATDDAWTADALELVETQMGVDGLLSAGYTPKPAKMQLTFQADSTSLDIMETLHVNQDGPQVPLQCFFQLRLPSTGRVYSAKKGFLTSYKPLPDGAATLKPRPFGFTWERIIPAPL